MFISSVISVHPLKTRFGPLFFFVFVFHLNFIFFRSSSLSLSLTLHPPPLKSRYHDSFRDWSDKRNDPKSNIRENCTRFYFAFFYSKPLADFLWHKHFLMYIPIYTHTYKQARLCLCLRVGGLKLLFIFLSTK
jgi:hypothetical protein